MRNLPILASEQAGVLCSVCPLPGHCCERFVFHKTFWIDEGLDAAQQALIKGGLPFEVLEWASNHYKSAAGREYATLICSCPKLSNEGRCTIYESRPNTCRRFVPGSDPLCVFEGSQGLRYWTPESRGRYLKNGKEKG
jgi:Fe-S-cluster containining protein